MPPAAAAPDDRDDTPARPDPGAAARSPARLAEPLLLGVIAVLYAVTAPSWVLGGDTGEFATLVVTDGVAHPPGYPLYAMLLRSGGWLTHWLEPAHVAALFSAVCGVATVGVCMVASRWLGASRIAALYAGALLGVAPLMWQLSTQPEVFALNTFFAASILATAAHGGRWRGPARVALLGLLAGLALSNHHSAVLLAPIGLCGAVRGVREAVGRRARAVALGLAGLVLGLVPYVWLLAADGAWQWGHIDTLGDLGRHFLRADYGTTELSGQGKHAPMAQLALLARHHLRDLLGVGALLAVVGAVRMLATPGARRVDGAALLASWLLAGPVFVAIFDLAPRDIGVLIVERFHLLPLVLLVPFVAHGLSALGPATRRLASRLGPRALRLGAVLGLVALTVLGAVRTIPHVREAQSPAVHHYIVNTLGMLPPDAVVVGIGDHLIFGMLYGQVALGLRPDVLYVDLAMLPHTWYRQRIELELGVALRLRVAGGELDEAAVIEDALGSGRPLFLTAVRSEAVLAQYIVYPLGGVVGVAAPGQVPPPPDELAAANVEIFDGFALAYRFPEAGASWAGDVHERYANTWLVLAGALDQMGKGREAAQARERARILAPWLVR